MKVGILGSGNMGRAVGIRLAAGGNQVFFGARKLEVAAEAAALADHESGHGSGHGSIDEAAAFGDILVWTMREADPAKVLAAPATLNGKIILDLNNRDYANQVRNGAWFTQSLAEQLAEQLKAHAPEAHVVKALNTLAMESFDIPSEELRRAGAQTFLAGNDPAAKQAIATLLAGLGLEAVDAGEGPAAFRAVEALGDVVRWLMIDGKRGGQAHLKLIMLPQPTLGSIGKRGESAYA